MKTYNQTAPDPIVLRDLVSRLAYRPGWRFALDDIDRGQGSTGLTFIVVSLGYDTYHHGTDEDMRTSFRGDVKSADAAEGGG